MDAAWDKDNKFHFLPFIRNGKLQKEKNLPTYNYKFVGSNTIQQKTKFLPKL